MAEDERKRGPAALSFAPVYSFTAAVVEMARGEERQAILEAFQREQPLRKSVEWGEGYDAAFTVLIRVLVRRSMV
jgi:hypothetical protein